MGILYVVATPIGNLEDISQRALRILSQVALIAAEDTRHTGKLLSHFQIDTPLISYHEHNKLVRLDRLLEALDRGEVALVSDAGTPAISDPGVEVVQAAWGAGHQVVPIPGPSAPMAALAASGLPTQPFLFLGFLPRQESKRRALLAQHARDPWTLVAFETPQRVQAALADLEATFGPDRQIALCRELTKLYEEIIRAPIGELRGTFDASARPGEFTLVIAGAEEDPRWQEDTVRAAVQERLALGDKPSSVARQVAKASGWRRADVYRLTLEEQ
ncbi:MAG TPA: 16S rRNA (cytidine(1402)-2'-O)-methyltransferase [Anaerolineales bacterium]